MYDLAEVVVIWRRMMKPNYDWSLVIIVHSTYLVLGNVGSR
jgi:hypothetical protein